MLPTDPRFTDLTDEQKGLLFAHWQRTNPDPVVNNNNAHDPDYPGVTDEEMNKQKYIDPDFDEEWNNLAIESADVVGGNDVWEEV